MADLINYKYYKGEAENPYQNKDFGKAFWWKVEMYAVQRNDEKERDMLSMTMVNYIKEHHWKGDGQHDTTKEEMLKRADELYNNGIWSRDYIGLKRYTFQQAVEYSKSDLLKFCRYYNGEDVAPYNSDKFNLIWLQEKRWVEDTLDVNSQMAPYLDRYSRDNMRDFEQFDDTPITLKAYLYAYFLKGNEMPSRDVFIHFYRSWYTKIIIDK